MWQVSNCPLPPEVTVWALWKAWQGLSTTVSSLERSGSSFTSATSVPVSLSLLLLECLQPAGSSLGQVAVFGSSRPFGKCSHPCPDPGECRLLHQALSLSLPFSPIYSSLAQIGTGDSSGVLPKQVCGHLDTEMPVTPSCRHSSKHSLQAIF